LLAQVFKFKDGKIAGFQQYTDTVQDRDVTAEIRP